MAWMGDVYRRIFAVWPTEDDSLGVVLQFECGHKQPSNLAPIAAIRMRETVCVACSKPNWDRLADIRAGITFDDVLQKLRKLKDYDNPTPASPPAAGSGVGSHKDL